MGIKQALLTGRGNQSQGAWIESPKMFSWINVKLDAICRSTCWHEHMYWPDKKQTSLSTRAWGNKSSFTRFPLQTRQHKQGFFFFLFHDDFSFAASWPFAYKQWLKNAGNGEAVHPEPKNSDQVAKIRIGLRELLIYTFSFSVWRTQMIHDVAAAAATRLKKDIRLRW